MPSDAAVIGGLAAAAVVSSLLIRWRNARNFPVPPGPKPYPFVGNVTDLDPRELWVTSAKWAKQYGTCTCRNQNGALRGITSHDRDALRDQTHSISLAR